MKGFELVGKPVEFGDVRITPEEAEIFRQSALEGMRVAELEIEDDRSLIVTSTYVTSMLADAWSDNRVMNVHAIGRLEAMLSPEIVRNQITFAHFRDSQRHTKIYNNFLIESMGDELVNAVRRVRVIRGNHDLGVEGEGYLIDRMVSKSHKGFETPMTSEHIEYIQRRTREIVGRATVLAAQRSGRRRI